MTSVTRNSNPLYRERVRHVKQFCNKYRLLLKCSNQLSQKKMYLVPAICVLEICTHKRECSPVVQNWYCFHTSCSTAVVRFQQYYSQQICFTDIALFIHRRFQCLPFHLGQPHNVDIYDCNSERDFRQV